MIQLFVTLLVIALLVAVFYIIPGIPAPFQTIALILGVVIALLVILQAFGLIGGFGLLSVPRIR